MIEYVISLEARTRCVGHGHDMTLSRHVLDMPKYFSNALVIFLLLRLFVDTLGHVGNTLRTCSKDALKCLRLYEFITYLYNTKTLYI